MEQKEELELANILAKLKKKGYSVFAQYDFSGGEDIFREIFITSTCKKRKTLLVRVAGLITTRKGLGEKPG